MYTVSRNHEHHEFVVIGSGGFKKNLPMDSIGLTLRLSPNGDWEYFAIRLSEMTEVEIVAAALEISAFPG